VCKAVDDANPYVATQVRWLRAFATSGRVERIWALTPRARAAQLPPNVSVHPFERGGRIRQSRNFMRAVAGLRKESLDFWFVSQGGPYPALLLPTRLARRIPVYHWKAHPHVSARMRFYARFCDDLVFTSTPGSLPLALDKVKVVGQGIDTDVFRPASGRPDRDLVVLGRVSPIKRIEQVVAALAEVRRLTGRAPSVDIVGPVPKQARPYRLELDRAIEEAELTGAVRFIGTVPHDEIPALLGRYRASVNLAETAFDKSAGEAMACGVPVVTSNARVAEVMPADLRSRLTVSGDDATAQAARITEVLAWDDAVRADVSRHLRDTIVRDHSMHTQVGRILDLIDEHLDRRHAP
jgi:glycosyltransferase involved in cell wall biosynthesis